MKSVVRYYRRPAFSRATTKSKLDHLNREVKDAHLISLQTELCLYIEVTDELTEEARNKLTWILTAYYQNDNLSSESSFTDLETNSQFCIEIGPRLNFSTPFSTNAVAICHSVGMNKVSRIETSVRYLLTCKLDANQDEFATMKPKIVNLLHDKMTQCQYLAPIDAFEINVKADPWFEVDVLTRGQQALIDVNQQLGLALDAWDIAYYTTMFRDKLKRNPTSVECFDLAQSNSEHSRHWFFKGILELDGVEQSSTLLDLVMSTQDNSNDNNVIKFSDNSSAICGFQVDYLAPKQPDKSSCFAVRSLLHHITFSAETHNFPTGVSPFSGATTGTGGRIRDTHAAGRGSQTVAATAGYCFGNLLIPEYSLPWEDTSAAYPFNFAHPRQIVIEASNGASDYGNKFGEPVVAGFARSFGMVLPNGERREWIKPIMFSGGIGTINGNHIKKLPPAQGMVVAKLGGPVYRIGVGGGAASSVRIQGDNKADLDFGAVQRGDAEMGQKLNRVVRACVEMGDENPICSIHDQGAGGNGNVLKEIVDPAGAVIYTETFQLGDPTINTLELWGAEYQESDAVLVKNSDKDRLQNICRREKCPVSFVGEVTGDGKIVLVEGADEKLKNPNVRNPVDLNLECVLGKMPQKTFQLDHVPSIETPLSLPDDVSVMVALDRVLRLPSVASKRFLTNKVDRCVTGLVAQQQCVGPCHTPLADVAVIALSYFDKVGGATSIGEQPVKALIDPAAGARMAVAESVTNLVFAQVSSLKDVKCSGNWMWPAKMPGEGLALYSACQAMTAAMKSLGIAVDGGKDSLSMVARVGKETVKSPGSLVISAYAPCPDITATVTPDLKLARDTGVILHVDLSPGKCRLGGTALAQVFNQLGDEVSDLEDAEMLKTAFNLTQKLVKERKIVSGHDVSDGGLITCVLEMAFAGNCGLHVNFPSKAGSHIATLFTEELGWILEVHKKDVMSILQQYQNAEIACSVIGQSVGEGPDAPLSISVEGVAIVKSRLCELRDVWEATSFCLEKLQATVECVEQERTGLAKRKAPPYSVSFDANVSPTVRIPDLVSRVAVLREEGTNGDREMAAAFIMAGFEVWDVAMTDLVSSRVTLKDFQGLIFPGGFSFADVLGSGKGWAASLLFNDNVSKELENFKQRKDTFSLGVCNGCQVMALLGWLAPNCSGEPVKQGVVLAPNLSERFECRFSTVRIEESASIMLSGMAGSVMGVWVAHGEGRFVPENNDVLPWLGEKHLLPIRYVDDDGNCTTNYPENPNGSPDGIAAVCSEDGRHLAVMPHPERCVLPWQWAWMPTDWKQSMKTSPWLRMFQNAFAWCVDQQQPPST